MCATMSNVLVEHLLEAVHQAIHLEDTERNKTGSPQAEACFVLEKKRWISNKKSQCSVINSMHIMHTCCFEYKQCSVLLPGGVTGDLTEEITFYLRHKGKGQVLNVGRGCVGLNRKRKHRLQGMKLQYNQEAVGVSGPRD